MVYSWTFFYLQKWIKETVLTYEMLTVAFGESTMSRTQFRLWYNRFKENREDINDDALTKRKFADDVGILFGSCQVIFTDVLGMKCATAKIVPKLIKFEKKKQSCMDIAQGMLTTFNDDPDLLKRVLTGDESWVYSQL